ncbi:peptidoglycan-binding protein [Streptomyces sp. NPDC005811]|uniref:peptidoglycan-binding protein n=1 Tax=Streptomyces sp. NPDC005811 TaxID=3154565 RepID=UPI0033F39051
MARRTALSAELDPRVRQLVTRMRRLKEHTGLSTRQLAAKTGYSEKSWERYLVGRSLPPREAVEALARLSGTDPVRLLALHEVATDAWGERRGAASTAETAPGAEHTPGPAAAPGRSLRVALVAGGVALVLAVSSAVLLVLRFDADADTGGGTAPAAAPASASSSPTPVYNCRVERIDGQWYAGISRTKDAELAYGSAGRDVAEAQCLLRRAGISPGGIDGMFGPLTQRAVKALQQRAGLDVDGMVGPHTWKALRG